MRMVHRALAWFIVATCGSAVADSRPNVLLIVLDDQNSFALRHDLAPEPVSPNLDRLAGRGVAFVHAQCAAPVCNPSRAALFSGLRPSTIGVYDNRQGTLAAGHRLERAVSLPGYFRQHGYWTAGGGKLFASSYGSAAGKAAWDEDEGPAARRRGHGPLPPKDQIPLNGVGKHDWGAFPDSREPMEDWQLAGWAADFLARRHDRPFMLACGIVKPHTPWYVPREYFDKFPPTQITIAELATDEAAGVPKIAREKRHPGDVELVRRRKELVAAYLASSRYADDCVGRILTALENSTYRDNTIVVVCGDNGYQFGEKNNWSKGTLWEGATQVPLIVAGPGIGGGRTCARAVSLLDVYPTLVELAGLPVQPQLEGTSLVPLLADVVAPRERPALTTSGLGNHALRNDRWRYIRYADGSEELYDLDTDPLEHENLANRADMATLKAGLRTWLPDHDEPRSESASKGNDDD